jgi:hypothetical protein
MNRNTRSVTAVMAAILMALGAGFAGAAEHRSLQGRYGMTAMGACLASPNGFLPNNVAIEPSSATSLVNRGVLIFEHGGTGSASIVQTQLSLPPAALATFSGSAEIKFNFKYHLGPDGSMTVEMLLDTYAATYLTGPNAGLRATFVTAPPLSPTWVWSGTVSADRKTLLLNNGDTPSRLRFSNGAETNVICQFERVLTRLTP